MKALLTAMTDLSCSYNVNGPLKLNQRDKIKSSLAHHSTTVYKDEKRIAGRGLCDHNAS